MIRGIAIVTMMMVLVLALLDSPIVAQSRDQGFRLNREGLAIKEKAKSYEDVQRAVDKYEEAIRIFQRIKFEEGIGWVLNNLGNVYKDWGQYSKAINNYERSLAIATKARDADTQANALMNLGIVYWILGQYPKAVEYGEKSLEVWRKTKDLKGEGQSLNNLGIIYDSWGQYPKAVEYYEKSFAVSGKSGAEATQAIALMNLGIVYDRWGQHSKAVEYHEKSLKIRRKVKDLKGEGQVWNNLGIAYNNSGQSSKAVESYEKSLEIARKLRALETESRTLTNLGLLHAQRGEIDGALASLEQAQAICKQIGLPTRLAVDYIGNVYLDIGDIQKAEPFVKQAGYESSLGRLHLLRSEYQVARQFYEKLLKEAEKNRNAKSLFTAYVGLGTAFEHMQDDPKAAEYYSKAVQLLEELRAGLSRTEREQFFDVRVGGFYRTEPYKGLARVLMRLNRPAEAFQRSEYAKARVFAEALSRLSPVKRFDVPPDILRTDAEINDQLAALKKNRQKAYEKENQQVVAALEPQIKELEVKLASHLGMLRERYPLFAATKYPEPMDMRQAALKDNEWVVAYDVTDSGFLVYLSRGRELVRGLFKPISVKELEILVQKFRQSVEIGAQESIRDKVKSFDFASSKALANMLLGDILPDLPTHAPLIIVPDGPLGVVPFEMLVLNEGGSTRTYGAISYSNGAEFFGDRNPISYYQSVTALTLARTLVGRQKASERILAMVDPVFSVADARMTKATAEKRRATLDKLTDERLMSFQSDLGLSFPRLALTGQLGESLKKTDPARTDLYEGFQAQKAVLFQKDLTAYRSCVFATHGYFGKDLPGIQEPVLILTLPNQLEGQDGFLRMSEVMGLKLNADIVTLTACQSGLGKQLSGEGTMGMGRAFQYAGAKSVLMSLWSVAESSSVDLATSFFKHLREGKSKLEALRLAREEIREAGYDHPFFWAPFILVGEVD